MTNRTNKLFLAILATVTIFTLSVSAQAKEEKSIGLYVNLATDDTVKAGHAFAHAGKMMERGHPITFFLNGKAVLIATKGVPQASFKGKSLQDWVKGLQAKGAKIIICRVCMKIHKIAPADLIDDAVQGSPEVVANYLFDPTYKVISW